MFPVLYNFIISDKICKDIFFKFNKTARQNAFFMKNRLPPYSRENKKFFMFIDNTQKTL